MEPKVGNGLQVPDSFGRFGKFGGKYVPETLMHALTELESAFRALSGDEEFQVYFRFDFLDSVEIMVGFLPFWNSVRTISGISSFFVRKSFCLN